MALDTGYPQWDARDDFLRARRRHALAAMRRRLRGRPATDDMLLPFDEVIAALGRRGSRDLGIRPVRLDSIVGSTDRRTGFDRRFRPTSDVVAQRFTRVDAAMRRGEQMPPIDVVRVGDAHFVQDGHHRVAAARALDWPAIDAHVIEVSTAARADRDLRLDDLRPARTAPRRRPWRQRRAASAGAAAECWRHQACPAAGSVEIGS
jgi:ParB-like nuclease domain